MILHAENVVKRYGDREVLSGCSYSFERPGTYVLMGPNGCGKSTFLRICALLELPDAGEIFFSAGDAPLPHDLALRRRMTLVLPRTGVFSATVFENVAYGLLVRGQRKPEAAERVRSVLDFVGLAHREPQDARTLSTGETQRLGIARALAIDPEILFLDEPTASVDEENRELIESLIGRLRKDGRTIIVMTTHDREQADRLADRRLFLRHGRIADEAAA